MPFKSKAQMRYMFANHPTIAKEFMAHTPNSKNLPEHVKEKIKKDSNRVPRGNKR